MEKVFAILGFSAAVIYFSGCSVIPTPEQGVGFLPIQPLNVGQSYHLYLDGPGLANKSERLSRADDETYRGRIPAREPQREDLGS